MANLNKNLFTTYTTTNAANVSETDLQNSYVGVLFDPNNRMMWHEGMPYGNASYDAIMNGKVGAEVFNHTSGTGTSHTEPSTELTVANIDTVSAGQNNEATGSYSHAEGESTKAGGRASHTEGYYTTTNGNFGAHAEGRSTKADGNSSHAEGRGTETKNQGEHAEGTYNYSVADKTISTVGIGDSTKPQNALRIDNDGSIYIGADSKNNNPCNYNGQDSAVDLSISNAPISLQELLSGSVDLYKEITWSDLVEARTNGWLIPGKLYRITDYTTTSSDTNTAVAGHDFDIVVLALSKNTLSEDAWAVKRDIKITVNYNEDGSIPNKITIKNGNSITEYIGDHTYDINVVGLIDGIEGEGDYKQIKCYSKELSELDPGMEQPIVCNLTGDLETSTGEHLSHVPLRGLSTSPGKTLFFALKNNDEIIYVVNSEIDDSVKGGPDNLFDIFEGSSVTIKLNDLLFSNGDFSLCTLDRTETGAMHIVANSNLVVPNIVRTLHYFDNSNLSAWKLKYCLDNDTDRFDWAEPNSISVESLNKSVLSVGVVEDNAKMLQEIFAHNQIQSKHVYQFRFLSADTLDNSTSHKIITTYTINVRWDDNRYADVIYYIGFDIYLDFQTGPFNFDNAHIFGYKINATNSEVTEDPIVWRALQRLADDYKTIINSWINDGLMRLTNTTLNTNIRLRHLSNRPSRIEKCKVNFVNDHPSANNDALTVTIQFNAQIDTELTVRRLYDIDDAGTPVKIKFRDSSLTRASNLVFLTNSYDAQLQPFNGAEFITYVRTLSNTIHEIYPSQEYTEIYPYKAEDRDNYSYYVPIMEAHSDTVTGFICYKILGQSYNAGLSDIRYKITITDGITGSKDYIWNPDDSVFSRCVKINLRDMDYDDIIDFSNIEGAINPSTYEGSELLLNIKDTDVDYIYIPYNKTYSWSSVNPTETDSVQVVLTEVNDLPSTLYIGSFYSGSTGYVDNINEYQDISDVEYAIITDHIFYKIVSDYVPFGYLINGKYSYINITNMPNNKGRGVIYYMKDEWDNECTYDFKNILIKYTDINHYTFSIKESSTYTSDASLNIDSSIGCKSNKINTIVLYNSSEEHLTGILTLPHNIFIVSNDGGEFCTNNTLTGRCMNNYFDSNCFNNTLANSSNIKLGMFCRSNCISDTNNLITGNECNYNNFNNCSNIHTGNKWHNNIFNNSSDCSLKYSTTVPDSFIDNCTDCKFNNVHLMSNTDLECFIMVNGYNNEVNSIKNCIFLPSICNADSYRILYQSDFSDRETKYIFADLDDESELKYETLENIIAHVL